MKKSIFFLLLALPFLFQSCFKDSCTREMTYIQSNPIYMTWEDIRADITYEADRKLEQPGKIYYFNDYLYINELREGVHIYNNTNPEAPTKVGFIKIPGNVDISIRNQTLFADNYTDLLAIDISDLTDPKLLKRIENVYYHYGETAQGVLVAFETEEVVESIPCDTDEDAWIQSTRNGGGFFLNAETAGVDFGGGGGDGLGGSLARFTLYDNYLYTIDDYQLHVYDIAQTSAPEQINTIGVGWQIETLFSYDDHLFIGSTTGMHIMDATNPAEPTHRSSYSHAFGCDPVFVKPPYAYVTLRDGDMCNDADNQLDLVDISDLSDPKLEKVFPMENPHGLSIRDNTLFVCEGDHGLKTFDISNPLELDENQLAHLRNIKSKDVISLPGENKILLVIGDDGFYQYDASSATSLDLLSRIPVGF